MASLQRCNDKQQQVTGYICPFMDDLVDTLYTPELNDLIEKTCQTNIDKRTFMMFIMMYFFTYLNTSIGSDVNVISKEDNKIALKVFMSDLIMNSKKREKCVELYRSFEKSIIPQIVDNSK